MSLMVSISGVRGIVGESLTPEVVTRFSAAFAEYCKRGAVVIGRDGRVTGKVVAHLVSSTLIASGCDVVALGIVPTPTVQLAVEKLRAAGGISITASHNPIEWNGLKFLEASGMFLNARGNARLVKIAENGKFSYAAWNGLGRHTPMESFIDEHIEAVLRLPYIDRSTIAGRKFKVVVDAVNGSGGVIVPKLLRRLGCEVVEMNCDQSGIFAHTPEPLPANLTGLCQKVTQERADLGVAVDPDSDRLVLITERGEPFGEEYTVTAVIRYILGRLSKTGKKQSVVVNLSTTRAVDDVAAQFGARVYRTPVGEINVAQKMKSIGAVVGGEGSGGVILPEAHLGRDAIVGVALLMQQLAESGGAVSRLKSSLPQYSIVKSKVGIKPGTGTAVIEGIRKRHKRDGAANNEDGLRLDFADSWVHLRTSNTEPILRIIGEARTVAEAEGLVRQFTGEIQEAKSKK